MKWYDMILFTGIKHVFLKKWSYMHITLFCVILFIFDIKKN